VCLCLDPDTAGTAVADTVVRRGYITKQGSKLVRWAAVEAIQRQPDTTKIALDRKRIEARRGRNVARIAAARKLLTLVYYGLRDGHIRALTPPSGGSVSISDATRARPVNCLTPGFRRGRRFD
jgi:hypothetical protein